MEKTEITPELVSRLIATQFPQWRHLPVRPVDVDGWDNATFRLGDTMSVRLPSAQWYVLQVDKEHRWLPVLAGQVPLPIPRPLARGVPGCGYPRPCAWTRGRGWAIWKAMKVLIGALKTDPDDAAYTKHVIEQILTDHVESVPYAPPD